MNPYISAGAASAYIALIALFINYVPRFESQGSPAFAAFTMLSLLVLSVAVMGFLFFYEPLSLYMEGRRAESIKHFFRTVAMFVCIVMMIFATVIFVLPLFGGVE